MLGALALLVAAPAAPAASPAPDAVFGLRAGGNPKLGYFVYRLAPGGSVSGTVIVSNVGTRAGTVRLYPVDATTGVTSGTVYRSGRLHPTAAGSWLHLAAAQVQLPPGMSATVPFSVRVPPGARPGEWVAGIVAESPEAAGHRATGGAGSVRIRVRNLTIVGVEVAVPGPTRLAFRIGGVRPGGTGGYQRLLVHLAATGNLLSRPGGSLTISSHGRRVQTLPFALDTFLPRTAIDYPLLLRRKLGPGRYTAAVVLRARPLAGGRQVVVHALRRFAISPGQVTKVFSSAAPTAGTPAGGGSRWTLAAAAGGGAAAALVLAAAAAVGLRRRRPAAA